jgi:hypothetical protein
MIHGDACFAYFNKIWGIPRMPPNVRLSDDLIDLMNSFSLSSAHRWCLGHHCGRRPPSTNASGNGKSVCGRCSTKDARIRADEMIE